jgi:hypothetical protein
LQAAPFDPDWVSSIRQKVCETYQVTEEESGYFLLEGQVVNTTYDPGDERVNILFRDGTVKDISKVDNALIHHNLASPVKKNYICYLNKPVSQ